MSPIVAALFAVLNAACARMFAELAFVNAASVLMFTVFENAYAESTLILTVFAKPYADMEYAALEEIAGATLIPAAMTPPATVKM